jgi:hypothetical protein
MLSDKMKKRAWFEFGRSHFVSEPYPISWQGWITFLSMIIVTICGVWIIEKYYSNNALLSAGFIIIVGVFYGLFAALKGKKKDKIKAA